MSEPYVLQLLNENGKTVTVRRVDDTQTIAFIVWQKNGGVKLPLWLRKIEAKKLRDMLDEALKELS